jgi:carboxyl-terminal processing protease
VSIREAVITAALLCCSTPLLAQDTTRSVLRKRTAAEDLQLFSQVLNQIRVNHPDSIDLHKLFMAAIEGLVNAADPHSYVIPAQRLAVEKEKALADGKLHPAPITFSFVGGSPLVVSVRPGSAAARLDILPGDELIAVDGRSVTAESPFELDIQLAGERGSTVELTFQRRRTDGSFAELKRRIAREKAQPADAIPSAFMLDATTGYARVTTFVGDKIGEELSSALDRLEKAGMRQLVLDLRDNGGGAIDEAAHVAGAFLPAGTVVYTAEGRKPEIAKTGKVQRGFWKNEKRYPIIVLINSGTASASELVAGALQDHDRALIVGRPSFGKALLMQTMPLSDGSLLALVIGHVKTPCGRVVQRQYRDINVRDYYRLARSERELSGRPSCRTDNGRTVYGGGGIYPDVLLPEPEPVPLWLARAFEQDLPLRWAGGFVSEQPASFTTLDALAAKPTLSPDAITSFRAFAAREGVTIPSDIEAAKHLERTLVLHAARAKWGEAGYYRILAALDPQLAAARKEFERAASILSQTK